MRCSLLVTSFFAAALFACGTAKLHAETSALSINVNPLVDLSADTRSVIHCQSVERQRDIVVTSLYRGSLDGPSWSKVVVYAYAGMEYRIVAASVTHVEGSSGVREWVYELDGWKERSRDLSTEDEYAFWEAYAEAYLNTTAKDLTTLGECTAVSQ